MRYARNHFIWHISILIFLSIPISLFLLLPLLSILFRFDSAVILENIQLPQVAKAIKISLYTSMISTLLTVFLGTPLAYFLARYKFVGKFLVDSLIDLPIVLPPLVVGIALLITFGRQGSVGKYLYDLGLNIAFTPTAVVLAQLFVGAPLYIRSAIVGFSNVDRDYEQAASLDGATNLQILQKITLPLAAPSLISGMVIGWARALGEFGATIVFAGNLPGYTQTIPLAIYLGFEANLNVALTLAIVLIVISLSILVVVKRLLQKQIFLYY
jgi:molybdate transport system permease protein